MYLDVLALPPTGTATSPAARRPLGRVPAHVVHAAFYSFAEGEAARHIPSANSQAVVSFSVLTVGY